MSPINGDDTVAAFSLGKNKNDKFQNSILTAFLVAFRKKTFSKSNT